MEDSVELPPVWVVVTPKRDVNDTTASIVLNLARAEEALSLCRIVERRLVAHSSSSVTGTPRARANFLRAGSDGFL